jgi:hypothetical protein
LLAYIRRLIGPTLLCSPFPATAQAALSSGETLDLTQAPVGLFSIGVFVLAYLLVMTEEFTHLPPFLGMMTGLAYLQFLSYYLKKTPNRDSSELFAFGGAGDIAMGDASESGYDFFRRLARAEWDRHVGNTPSSAI